MSLRARLFAAIVAAVLLATIMTVAVSEIVLHHRAESQALRTLQSEASVTAGAPLRAVAAGLRPRADRRALQGASGRGAVFALAAGPLSRLRLLPSRQARTVLAAIPASPVASGHVTVGGRELLYASGAGPLGRIVLVRSARLGKGDAPGFALAVIVVGLLGLLLAALLAWLLARRLTKPLRELEAASRELPRLREPPALARPAGAPREIVSLVDTYNEMGRELALARSSERDFLLAASHELKSPISAIAAHAEGIQDGAVAPDEAARVILAESRRLERLVRDLLDLARLDRREFDIERQPVQLSSIASMLLERHGSRARDLGIQLTVSGRKRRPVVWGDPGRLMQAASNLVENALRVTPSGGVVEIELVAGALVVSDRGPGLSAEERERAFERFYLHRRDRDASHNGAGLGLAVVRELLRAMGGDARAEERAGGGSRFVLALEPAEARRLPVGVGDEVAGVARR